MLNETSTTVDGNKNVMNEAHTVVIDDFHSGTNFTTSTLAIEMNMVQNRAV